MHAYSGIRVGLAALAVAGWLAGCSSSTAGVGAGGGFPTTPQPSGDSIPAPTGSGGTAGVPSPSAPATPTTHPVPTRPLLTKAIAAGGGVTYVVKIWAQQEDSDCAAHAYGAPMIQFLTRHPCVGVTRRLVTTTVNGRQVGFAQNSIGFKGNSQQAVYAVAGRFRALVSRDGTGNLNDLLREGYRLPTGPTSVPSPDAFLALAQDNAVSVVDAWYLQGSTPSNDPALIKMARDIYLQF